MGSQSTIIYDPLKRKLNIQKTALETYGVSISNWTVNANNKMIAYESPKRDEKHNNYKDYCSWIHEQGIYGLRKDSVYFLK